MLARLIPPRARSTLPSMPPSWPSRSVRTALCVAVLGALAGGCARCGPSKRPGAAAVVTPPVAAPLAELALGRELELPAPADAGAGWLPAPAPAAARLPGLRGELISLELAQDLTPPVLYGGHVPASHRERSFAVHRALDAAALGSDWVVVLANTGLWLHEADSLARRARLAPPPLEQMAASPDGRAFAYATAGRPYRLRIASFPELRLLVPGVEIDEPRRIRFSPDGRRVITASNAEETVTVIDVATGRAVVHDTGDDVNDAVVLPDRPFEVAWSGDSDEAYVYDMAAGRQRFRSGPLHRPAAGKGYVARDQNAVAFDPATGDLFSGGDDNKVWRFEGYRTAEPSAHASPDFAGNVEDLACCRKGSLVVALDSMAVHLADRDGATTTRLGPFFGRSGQDPVRVSLAPDDRVLAVLGGRVVIWDPADGVSRLARDYHGVERWTASESPADTVLYACSGDSCAIYRAAAETTGADVAAARLGALALSSAIALVDFDDGSRALVGSAPGGALRGAHIDRGTLGPAVDEAAAPITALVRRADRRSALAVDAGGAAFEIVPDARCVRRLAHPALGPIVRADWDAAAGSWVLEAAGKPPVRVAGRP